ncbi:hypothetical protein ACI6QG_15810 [Roseococcus sp. DSY-14]
MSDTPKAPDAPPGTTEEEAAVPPAAPKPTAEQMREAMEREGGNMTRDD